MPRHPRCGNDEPHPPHRFPAEVDPPEFAGSAVGPWFQEFTCPGQFEPQRCRFKSAHSCRVCRRWFEVDWFRADAAGRVEIQRQMDAGHCDRCHAEYC